MKSNEDWYEFFGELLGRAYRNFKRKILPGCKAAGRFFECTWVLIPLRFRLRK